MNSVFYLCTCITSFSTNILIIYVHLLCLDDCPELIELEGRIVGGELLADDVSAKELERE